MLRILYKIYRARGKSTTKRPIGKDHRYTEGDAAWFSEDELNQIQPHAPVLAGFGYTNFFLRLLERTPSEDKPSFLYQAILEAATFGQRDTLGVLIEEAKSQGSLLKILQDNNFNVFRVAYKAYYRNYGDIIDDVAKAAYEAGGENVLLDALYALDPEALAFIQDRKSANIDDIRQKFSEGTSYFKSLLNKLSDPKKWLGEIAKNRADYLANIGFYSPAQFPSLATIHRETVQKTLQAVNGKHLESSNPGPHNANEPWNNPYNNAHGELWFNDTEQAGVENTIAAWREITGSNPPIQYLYNSPPFGFNKDAYEQLRPLCHMAERIERNGELHKNAHTLSIIFGEDFQNLFNYVEWFHDEGYSEPVHAASNLALPRKGKWTPQLWREPLVAYGKNVQNYIQQAVEIERQVIEENSEKFKELLLGKFKGVDPNPRRQKALQRIPKDITEKELQEDLAGVIHRLPEDLRYWLLQPHFPRDPQALENITQGFKYKNPEDDPDWAKSARKARVTNDDFRRMVEVRSQASEITYLPRIIIDGAKLGLGPPYDKYYFCYIPKKDPNLPVIGKMVLENCQYAGNPGGQESVELAITSPWVEFYGLCQKRGGQINFDGERITDPIITGSWAFIDPSFDDFYPLVLDSVAMSKELEKNPYIEELVRPFLRQLAHNLKISRERDTYKIGGVSVSEVLIGAKNKKTASIAKGWRKFDGSFRPPGYSDMGFGNFDELLVISPYDYIGTADARLEAQRRHELSKFNKEGKVFFQKDGPIDAQGLSSFYNQNLSQKSMPEFIRKAVPSISKAFQGLKELRDPKNANNKKLLTQKTMEVIFFAQKTKKKMVGSGVNIGLHSFGTSLEELAQKSPDGIKAAIQTLKEYKTSSDPEAKALYDPSLLAQCYFNHAKVSRPEEAMKSLEQIWIVMRQMREAAHQAGETFKARDTGVSLRDARNLADKIRKVLRIEPKRTISLTHEFMEK